MSGLHPGVKRWEMDTSVVGRREHAGPSVNQAGEGLGWASGGMEGALGTTGQVVTVCTESSSHRWH